MDSIIKMRRLFATCPDKLIGNHNTSTAHCPTLAIETDRLYLRKISKDDTHDITDILGDIDVMYAWEHAFTDAEVKIWIEENITRYERDGFSYWTAIQKSDGKLIGVAGLLREEADGESHIGLGYIFARDYWHQGFALECALGCLDYARGLGFKEVTAQVRPDNTPSRKLAEKLGMIVKKEFIRVYKNKEMPHLLYSLNLG